MSTSLSPRSSGSLGGSGHPTRQQLDELDALLQRMLALPVNQADDDVTAEINALPRTAPAARKEPGSYHTVEANSSSSEQAEPKASTRKHDAHVSAADETTGDADNWVPLSSTWKPSPHTWKPLAQSWQQPRVKPSAQEPPPAREEQVEVPAARPTMPPPKPAAIETPPGPVVVAKSEPKPILAVTPPPVPAQVAEDPPLPGWIEPLVWFNIAFDYLLLPWGLPGRWLRRDGGGRSVLGAVGVLLLTATIVLGILEWFGWTWDDFLARIR